MIDMEGEGYIMLTSFNIGVYSFSTYWTIFATGVLFMIIMNCISGRKYSLHMSTSVFLTISIVLISFAGAKILYYLENPDILFRSGIKLGGVSFFGSVFLVPVLMYFICRVLKQPYLKIMDYVSPSLMLMLAILRIGCYFSGCCGGREVIIAGFYIEKFPTQIMECICDLLILLGLLMYKRFWHNEGRLYFFIMLYYGIVRFFIEFFRDTPKDFFYLSLGQCFSIISILIGGYVLQFLGKMDRKKLRFRKR